MITNEDQLCAAFAEQVKENSAFAIWLLQKTKFAPFAGDARLQHEEQLAAQEAMVAALVVSRS